MSPSATDRGAPGTPARGGRRADRGLGTAQCSRPSPSVGAPVRIGIPVIPVSPAIFFNRPLRTPIETDTQVFARPVQGRQFFEAVIRENLDLGRPDRVGLEQMFIGVATSQYARSLEPLGADVTTRGTSKSAVSRHFVAQTQAQLDAWRATPLDGVVAQIRCEVRGLDQSRKIPVYPGSIV